MRLRYVIGSCGFWDFFLVRCCLVVGIGGVGFFGGVLSGEDDLGNWVFEGEG